MESPLNETPTHHYRTRSNIEHNTMERPKMQRRLSSYNRNEHKRKLYNDSNTFITTVDNGTIITKDDKDITKDDKDITKDDKDITKDNKDINVSAHSTYFGFFSSPINNVDIDNKNISNNDYNEPSGKEITENFFKNLDNTLKGNKEE
jgi:hypothetical protein